MKEYAQTFRNSGDDGKQALKIMWWIDFLIGTATGVLSGFGIGGGTLLILWLTLAAGLNQWQAGGVNLVYFLFSATPALVSHVKNQLVEKKVLLYCVIGGTPACILAAILANQVEVGLLRKGFGVLLLFIGIRELFAPRAKKEQKSSRGD